MENRTPVTALRRQCPKPLDDRADLFGYGANGYTLLIQSLFFKPNFVLPDQKSF